MSFLAAGLLAKRIGGAVWAWLSHATLWQIVAIGLAGFALVQHFQLLDARHDAVNYSRQRDELKRQLDAISAKRNEQKVITRDNIVTVTKTIHDADGRAKVIEQAPLPGNCKTPPEIIGADL